jgi:hypothetical protein
LLIAAAIAVLPPGKRRRDYIQHRAAAGDAARKETHGADGHASEAKSRLRQAKEIFQRIGAAEASGVGAELDAIPYGAPIG